MSDEELLDKARLILFTTRFPHDDPHAEAWHREWNTAGMGDYPLGIPVYQHRTEPYVEALEIIIGAVRAAS